MLCSWRLCPVWSGRMNGCHGCFRGNNVELQAARKVRLLLYGRREAPPSGADPVAGYILQVECLTSLVFFLEL